MKKQGKQINRKYMVRNVVKLEKVQRENEKTRLRIQEAINSWADKIYETNTNRLAGTLSASHLYKREKFKMTWNYHIGKLVECAMISNYG